METTTKHAIKLSAGRTPSWVAFAIADHAPRAVDQHEPLPQVAAELRAEIASHLAGSA